MTETEAGSDKAEWLAERAAIMEHDGGLSREDADRKALEQWEKKRTDKRTVK